MEVRWACAEQLEAHMMCSLSWKHFVKGTRLDKKHIAFKLMATEQCWWSGLGWLSCGVLARGCSVV